MLILFYLDQNCLTMNELYKIRIIIIPCNLINKEQQQNLQKINEDAKSKTSSLKKRPKEPIIVDFQHNDSLFNNMI